MFYLLSEGGRGANDLATQYSLEGVSMKKAANIMYRATTRYLSMHSNFKDFRNAMSQAA